MKKQVFVAGLAIALSSCGGTEVSNENSESAEFMVYGNCGMCEKTIEGSLAGVNGVFEADWNPDDDMIAVSFDTTVISLNEIKQKIADVGYDSENHRASDEVYNKLPGCCQYDRPVD